MNGLKTMFLALFLMTSSMTMFAQEASSDPDIQYAADLLKTGTEAPDFVISGIDSTYNQPLSRLRGQYVVLDFWASWCPDCRKDIPAVKIMFEKYGKGNVQFVGISFDTNKLAWRNYIAKSGMKWLQHSELKKWKRQTKIDSDYHINWIPTYYLLNPEGKVVVATVQHEKIEAKLSELAAAGKLKSRATSHTEAD